MSGEPRRVGPSDDPWAGLSVPSEHRPRLSLRPVPDEFTPPLLGFAAASLAPLAPPSPRDDGQQLHFPGAPREDASPPSGPDGPHAEADLQYGASSSGAPAKAEGTAEQRSVEEQLCSAVAALLHERLLPVFDARLRATLAEELPPLLHAAMGVPAPRKETRVNFDTASSYASAGSKETRVNFNTSASYASAGSSSHDALCLTKVALEEVLEPATKIVKRVPQESRSRGEPGPEPTPDCVYKTQSTPTQQTRYTHWSALSRRMTSTKETFQDRMAMLGARLQIWFHTDHPLWDGLSVETSFVAWVVDSYLFGFGISSLVILNSIHLGLTADYQVRTQVSQEHNDPASFWLVDVVDAIFVWMFLIEVGLRIYAERRVFFFGGAWRWNLFDVVLLTYSFLEEYGGFRSFSFLRKLRMLRLVRVLHVLQHVEHLEVLRRMISSIMRSVIPVIWVMVVFLLLIYMFSLFFVESIVDFVKSQTDEASEVPDDRALADALTFREHYGTLGRTMISLFMAISGGDDWSNVIAPLWKINVITPGIFMGYLVFMVFAVVNIVTGIFVEQAMEVAEVDKEKVVHMRVKALHELAREIKFFFREMDEDHNGSLQWEEFERHLDDPRVSGYFETLGIEPASAQHVFTLLDNETHAQNSVPINAFIDGCMRFRGPAKSVDVALLMMECHKQKDELRALSKFIRGVL